MSDGGNLKVVVRCRPLNSREKSRGAAHLIDIVDERQLVLNPFPSESEQNEKNARATKKKPVPFSFDRMFGEKTKQHEVFDFMGVELIDHAFAGFNTCVFAYGQTGSGKSHSMVGYAAERGLIPLTCSHLFNQIGQLTSNDPNLTCSVEVSYFEIYNEKVHDLLNPKNKSNLKVREHPIYGPYVEDLSKLVVNDFDGIEHLMDEGNKARTVAATNMNATSSRSHAVITLVLTQKRKDPDSKAESEKVSRISLVDLAGSERANSTGATGARLKEGANINRSLTTLGKVIAALAKESEAPKGPKKKSSALDSFVPYRDSVLTWLLKDSLGGNSKTAMIAAISPADYEETLSTLRYADQAKKIQNKAVVNEDPNAKLIRQLKEELEMLRARAGIPPRNQLGGAATRGGGDAVAAAASGLTSGGETGSGIQAPMVQDVIDPSLPPEKQVIHYQTTSGQVKSVTKAELQEQMEENEKLVSSLQESWEQKISRTQEIHREREQALEAMGITIDKANIGVHTPRFLPHLVNLNEDPLMSECLIYQIKPGVTVVCRQNDDSAGGDEVGGEGHYGSNLDSSLDLDESPDQAWNRVEPNEDGQSEKPKENTEGENEWGHICLSGTRILPRHSIIYNDQGRVTIEAVEDSLTMVNGKRLAKGEKKRLHSGYRVILGDVHVFRFNHPEEARKARGRLSTLYPQSSNELGLGISPGTFTPGGRGTSTASAAGNAGATNAATPDAGATGGHGFDATLGKAGTPTTANDPSVSSTLVDGQVVSRAIASDERGFSGEVVGKAGDDQSAPTASSSANSPDDVDDHDWDWTFARREAALAALKGEHISFEKFQEDELERLFDDVQKAHLSKRLGGAQSGSAVSSSGPTTPNASTRSNLPTRLPLPEEEAWGNSWGDNASGSEVAWGGLDGLGASTSPGPQQSHIQTEDSPIGPAGGAANANSPLQPSDTKFASKEDAITPDQAGPVSGPDLAREAYLLKAKVREYEAQLANAGAESGSNSADMMRRESQTGPEAVGVPTPLTPSRRRLGLTHWENELSQKYFHMWRGVHGFRMAESLLQNVVLLKQANVLARHLGEQTVYQFTVVGPDAQRESKFTPSCSIVGLDELEEMDDPFLAGADKPCVGVKVLDFQVSRLRTWSLSKLADRVNKMQSLVAVTANPSVRQFFCLRGAGGGAEGSGMDDEEKGYTYVGKAVISLLPVLKKVTLATFERVPVWNTHEQQVSGYLRARVRFISLVPSREVRDNEKTKASSPDSKPAPNSQDGQSGPLSSEEHAALASKEDLPLGYKLSFSLSVDQLGGFNTDHFASAHLQIRHPGTAPDGTSSTPFVSNEKGPEDRHTTGTSKLQLQRAPILWMPEGSKTTLASNVTASVPVDLTSRAKWKELALRKTFTLSVTPSLQRQLRQGLLEIELHARITQDYLEQVEAYDLSRSSLNKTLPLLSPPTSMIGTTKSNSTPPNGPQSNGDQADRVLPSLSPSDDVSYTKGGLLPPQPDGFAFEPLPSPLPGADTDPGSAARQPETEMRLEERHNILTSVQICELGSGNYEPVPVVDLSSGSNPAFTHTDSTKIAGKGASTYFAAPSLAADCSDKPLSSTSTTSNPSKSKHNPGLTWGAAIPPQALIPSLDGHTFFLRQGFQRKICLRLRSESGRQVGWTRLRSIELGLVRLVDGNRVISSTAMGSDMQPFSSSPSTPTAAFHGQETKITSLQTPNSPQSQNFVPLRVAPGQQTLTFLDDGTSELTAWVWWDSSVHESALLTAVTPSNTKVVVRARAWIDVPGLQPENVESYHDGLYSASSLPRAPGTQNESQRSAQDAHCEGVVLEMDWPMIVQRRDAKFSSSGTGSGLGAGVGALSKFFTSKLAASNGPLTSSLSSLNQGTQEEHQRRQSCFLHSLLVHPALTTKRQDLWRVDTANTYVRGQEGILGTWRPRRLSLLRDYYDATALAERKAQVAGMKAWLLDLDGKTSGESKDRDNPTSAMVTSRLTSNHADPHPAGKRNVQSNPSLDFASAEASEEAEAWVDKEEAKIEVQSGIVSYWSQLVARRQARVAYTHEATTVRSAATAARRRAMTQPQSLDSSLSSSSATSNNLPLSSWGEVVPPTGRSKSLGDHLASVTASSEGEKVGESPSVSERALKMVRTTLVGGGDLPSAPLGRGGKKLISPGTTGYWSGILGVMSTTDESVALRWGVLRRPYLMLHRMSPDGHGPGLLEVVLGLSSVRVEHELHTEQLLGKDNVFTLYTPANSWLFQAPTRAALKGWM